MEEYLLRMEEEGLLTLQAFNTTLHSFAPTEKSKEFLDLMNQLYALLGENPPVNR
jgi:hypothetical protein